MLDLAPDRLAHRVLAAQPETHRLVAEGDPAVFGQLGQAVGVDVVESAQPVIEVLHVHGAHGTPPRRQMRTTAAKAPIKPPTKVSRYLLTSLPHRRSATKRGRPAAETAVGLSRTSQWPPLQPPPAAANRSWCQQASRPAGLTVSLFRSWLALLPQDCEYRVCQLPAVLHELALLRQDAGNPPLDRHLVVGFEEPLDRRVDDVTQREARLVDGVERLHQLLDDFTEFVDHGIALGHGRYTFASHAKASARVLKSSACSIKASTACQRVPTLMLEPALSPVSRTRTRRRAVEEGRFSIRSSDANITRRSPVSFMARPSWR